VASKLAQKALEVRTPLVQNGADEHGPDRGDITAEWAHIGRLTAVYRKLAVFKAAGGVWALRSPATEPFPRGKPGKPCAFGIGTEWNRNGGECVCKPLKMVARDGIEQYYITLPLTGILLNPAA
jgi:hypothetical protein